MTLTEIERTLRELRLSGIAATLNTRVMQRSPRSSRCWRRLQDCCKTSSTDATRA